MVIYKSFQNFISNANPETLTALAGWKAEKVSSDLFKAASNMISNVSSEEIQKMIQMTSLFWGGIYLQMGVL